MGHGLVVDGIAKFQALKNLLQGLNFPVKSLVLLVRSLRRIPQKFQALKVKFLKDSPSNQQKKGFYWLEGLGGHFGPEKKIFAPPPKIPSRLPPGPIAPAPCRVNASL